MKSRWKRVVLFSLLGVVVLVLAAGGGFYLWFQHQVGEANARVDPAIVEALKEKPSTTTTSAASTTAVSGGTSPGTPSTVVESTTTSAPFESPSGMTIVLLGFDERAEGSSEVTEGRSDVIILVHIDPDKGFLSLLSVPRDLRVKVEGFGHRKINAAYAYGGGALLIRTIQNELGIDLDHYIAVNLEAFKAITDALGGVYIDVDRAYSDGKIEFEPGYQLLDGLNAQRFVRTRHDQNIDFGRMARQQRYLSAVRQQVMRWNLPLKLPGLIKTIFKYADTDLSANEVLKLAYWVMRLDSNGIKRAEIIGATGAVNGSFYILPTDEELAVAIADFYTPPAKITRIDPGESKEPAATVVLTPADLRRVPVDVVNSTSRVGQGAMAGLWLERQGASLGRITTGELPVSGKGLVQYPGSRLEAAQSVAQALGIQEVEKNSSVDRVTVILGTDYAIAGDKLAGVASTPLRLSAWQALQKESGLALMAPSFMPSDFSYSFDRSYDLETGDDAEPAVRVGYRYKSRDLYAGVSATAWKDAPLAGSGVELKAGGITYTVVGAANKPDHVWWIEGNVLYWASNTLFGDLSREELLAVALSAVVVPAAH